MDEDIAAESSVQPREIRRAPLSFPQERLCLLEQITPTGNAYNLPVALNIRGPLNVAALQQALCEIVNRHEVLRTAFADSDVHGVQVVFELARPDFTILDISSLTPVERAKECERRCNEAAQRPFDLRTPPLFRQALIRNSADDHVLIITAHHAVCDGWSLSKVLPFELKTLYSAFAAGLPSTLPPLLWQYADYAVRERARLQGSALDRRLRFWREYLRGCSPLDIPADRARPPKRRFCGRTYSFQFAAGTRHGLDQLRRTEGATIFMVLLAAFEVMLARWTGQTDIVVGSAVAGRNHRNTFGMVGMFVNVLPIRLDVSGDPSFAVVLHRMRKAANAAYAYQDTPLERIVAELPLKRDLSRQPLFEVAFNWHSEDRLPFQLPGLSFTPLTLEGVSAPFDMSWHVVEQDGNLFGGVEYSTDLFEASTIERLVQSYQQVLQAVSEDPTVPISQLPLLSEVDRHRQLVEWNARAREYPKDRCIHELFEEQVERACDAVAVVYEEGQLTYAELNRRANQLAHYLRGHGVQADTRVGICIEPSLEMIVGLLGILKSGGAYVPLDPGYPRERLRYMMEDATPGIVLTQERLKGMLVDIPARVVSLDGQWSEVANCSEANVSSRDIGLTSKHLAYVIYTSGSTGQPKGVMIEHANVVRLFSATGDWFHFDHRDTWTLFHSISFDFSVWEIWGALSHGGRLIVVPYHISRSPEAFYELLCRHAVTVLNQTPSAFRQLINAPVDSNRALNLRYVIFGGEALNMSILTPWYERNPVSGPQLINMYGITETTVHVSYRALERRDADRLSAGSPIGARIPDLRVYILDAHWQPVPIGVVGELYVGGAGVARGYLKRPELTAERFLRDPYCEDADARMYRTGDLGKYLPDGSIEFIGRNDHQVKIRGFRIEQGEIEARLMRYPQVKEAAVIACEDFPGEQRLVAYFTAQEKGVPNAEELRNYLKESLPEYMVPAAYVLLRSLPLTASGKVDRSSLPAPDRSALSVKKYEAPQGEIEEAVAQTWRELLSVQWVGRDDNFFDLGGHSLHAMRVIARIREQFKVELPLRALFDDAATVRAQAGKIVELYRAQQGVQWPELLPRGQDVGELPLSFMQERLYFLEQLRALGSPYNIGMALRLDGTVDLALLERSLVELVERHESLRTRFELRAGRALQLIDAVGQFRPERCELPDAVHGSRVEERWLSREMTRPFDLSQGAFRVVLVSAPDHRLILLVVMHHIVSDGWSLAVLVRELSVLYAAYLRGEPSPLAPLRVQYADYALWQRQWLQGEVLEKQLSYWREQLSGMPAALELPIDHSRPPVPSFRGATHGFTVPAEQVQALRALGRREEVTLYMVLLAALQVVLGRWSNQQDVAVGSPIAGRTHRLTEGLIGFFVNTLVMRTDLSGEPQFRELLQRVRETALGAYVHQEMPFEKLVAELQPQRDLSRQALFQVMFTLQNAPVEHFDLPGLTLTPITTEWSTSKFDLELDLFENEKGLFGRMAYATDLFEASTIERLTQSYCRVLQAVGEDATVAISRLPLLSEADRHRQLVEWNATAREYPKDRCVHELFAQQVMRTPDAIALVCGAEQLRYRELDERANQLAHHLISLGMRTEQVTGVCIARSTQMVIGLLAVLKAGGAYLPLDPTHPAQRLSYMLKDAGALIVLTDGNALTALLSGDLRVVDVHTHAMQIGACPLSAPHTSCASNNRACVIYTSGSTGRAKGVEVIHSGITRLVLNTNFVNTVPEDCVGQLANVSFDATTQEVWSALLNGSRLALYTSPALNAQEVRGFIVRHGVSVLGLTTSLLNFIVDDDVSALAGLRCLVFAGEKASSPHVQRVLQQLRGCEIVNAYGPTEGTTCATAHTVTRLDESTNVPIGRAISNTQVYVLDELLQPVPIGVIGELCIGGDGLARGYLGRPGLTAERFVANPFGGPGTRLYRSGDRVRWRPAGYIEFVGRTDTQLKIRGFRIEPAEIEAALMTHPRLARVAVLAREDAQGQKMLVAYVANTGGPVGAEALGARELREHLRTILPEYMVPAQFVFVEQLKLNSSGKVDRRALPEPDALVNVSAQYVAPATPTEEVLSRIWANALGLERVSVSDNFFDVGGHSIMLLRVHRELVSQVDARILVTDLFRYPTIRQLCDYLAAVPTAREDAGRIDRIALQKTYFERAAGRH